VRREWAFDSRGLTSPERRRFQRECGLSGFSWKF